MGHSSTFRYEPDKTDRRRVVGQIELTQFSHGQAGTARPTTCPHYELGRTGAPCS